MMLPCIKRRCSFAMFSWFWSCAILANWPFCTKALTVSGPTLLVQGHSNAAEHLQNVSVIDHVPTLPSRIARAIEDRLAKLQAADEVVDVAVVGSGPISEADRKLISGAKEVYRFNSMNNLRRGEKVGTVFLRRGGFRGGNSLSGLPPSDAACPLIDHADGLVIVMNAGPPIDSITLKHLRKHWRSVKVAEESPDGVLLVDGRGVTAHPHGFSNFERLGRHPQQGFSTGFVGAVHVLNNSPLVKQGKKVHIFGMNWKASSKHAGGHPFSLEKSTLVTARQVVIHPAAAPFYKPRDLAGHLMWTCEGAYVSAKAPAIFKAQ